MMHSFTLAEKKHKSIFVHGFVSIYQLGQQAWRAHFTFVLLFLWGDTSVSQLLLLKRLWNKLQSSTEPNKSL